jgi:hypothetical protein
VRRRVDVHIRRDNGVVYVWVPTFLGGRLRTFRDDATFWTRLKMLIGREVGAL